jgi:Trk K+ transport system NAD-binding subunit
MPAVVVGSDDEFITPDGSTTLEEGDTLLALVKKENLDRVREILSPERRNDVRD